MLVSGVGAFVPKAQHRQVKAPVQVKVAKEETKKAGALSFCTMLRTVLKATRGAEGEEGSMGRQGRRGEVRMTGRCCDPG